jgi:hypothetical protein
MLSLMLATMLLSHAGYGKVVQPSSSEHRGVVAS